MKKFIMITPILAVLLLVSGCVQRELVLSEPEVAQSKENTWAKETNEEDNIDISDLEEDTLSQTEEQTDISENLPSEKMPRIDFPAEEYNTLARSGKATVKGSIYIKDGEDKRIFAKGTRLYLNPVTSYSEQWYDESYLEGNKLEKADSRLFNYLRFTASNNQGEFAFYGVPSGRYYLIGTVKCGYECGYETAKSIRIATMVSVHGNKILQKDLTRHLD